MTNPDPILYPDLVQGTDDWYAARCGILTASVVGALLTPTLKVAGNATSRAVTNTIVAERITNHVDPTAMSADMWRGVEDEPRARDAYGEHYAEVVEMGFMIRDFDGCRLGYSPDGLVDESGLIEIKSRRQKHHLATILDGEVPAEYMAQIQCGLLVSGREWCDFISFCGGMPLWVRRVEPDPVWHAAITEAAQAFEADAAEILARYGQATAGLPMTERVTGYVEMVI